MIDNEFEMGAMFPDRIIEQIKLRSVLKNRTVYLQGEINDDSALKTEYFLERIAKQDTDSGKKPEDCDPIILKINSPGGCVYSTMSIISTIESLKLQGFTIHTYATGIAMSGAFKVLISGSRRFCKKYTHMMCHQPSEFLYNYAKLIDQKRNAKILDEVWKKLQDIIVQYTNITYTQLQDITEQGKDWYFWAEEAIEYGIIDEII